MKRVFVSVSLILALVSTAVAGKKPGVNDKIRASFAKQFAEAEVVKWEEVNDYQKATFGLFGHRVIAYFDQEGELMGSARDMQFDQLPLIVMRSFDERFTDADLIDIHEVTNVEGTCYLLTVQNQTTRYRVKADVYGNILAKSKIKK